jgi:YD repeat-containing protein
MNVIKQKALFLPSRSGFVVATMISSLAALICNASSVAAKAAVLLALLLTATTESDAKQGLIRATDTLGQVWQYGYDADGQISQRTDPAGGVIRIEYDNNAKAPNDVPQGWGQVAVAAVANSTYEGDVKPLLPALAQVGKLTNERGQVTLYNSDYDKIKKHTSIETQHADGSVVLEVYDAQGYRLLHAINGVTQMARTRNTSGSTEQLTNARGQVTQRELNSSGLPWRVTHPDGAVEEPGYGKYGSIYLERRVDALGTVTEWKYAQRADVSAPGGTFNAVTSRARNLTRMTEALGLPQQRTTLYTRDAWGRILSQTTGARDASGPDARTTGFTYDSAGNISRLTNALGQSWAVQYW